MTLQEVENDDIKKASQTYAIVSMNFHGAKDCAAKTDAAAFDGSRLNASALFELTKPRLSLLSVFTAALGYLAYYPLQKDASVFLSMMLGTTLAAGGAAALNQWMERREDARMPRTAGRPLPSRAVEPEAALTLGLVLAGAGLLALGLGTNVWATGLTFATLVSYLLVYTPMKKWTAYATETGAVAGALPPLIGWVAAAGEPTAFGWLLFGILFAWQLPHFMAIAWTYREDYRRGGFVMPSHLADGGASSARKSLAYSLLLTVLVFAPFLAPMEQPEPGLPYLLFAIPLSAYLLFASYRFLHSADRDFAARKLFHATIIYLPLLLVALVADRYL